MRLTLIIDDELFERARAVTGIVGKTAVIHAGLNALIARGSAPSLANLGGTQKRMRAIPRRKPPTE